MASVQDNAAIAQQGYDAYNRHASDPRWLDYTAETVSEDCEVVDVPNGAVFRGPAGDIPPTGRSWTLQFCDVYKFRDGKMVSHRTYYDALGLLHQLGLVP